MSNLDWLTARPIAHRGLHDAAAGVIENTRSAFARACEAGYAIEVDLQLSADGEAMVFHDDALERLTAASGPLSALAAAELKTIPLRGTSDRMLTLGDLCELVSGRAPLLVEMKSRFDGDRRLVARAAHVLKAYRGPAAVMSFDPRQVIELRSIAPQLVRGVAASRRYDHPKWKGLPRSVVRRMAYFLHFPQTRPQFIAYGIADLPALPPLAARWILGLPLLTWTVRTADERRRAARWADQIIFEGFRP